MGMVLAGHAYCAAGRPLDAGRRAAGMVLAGHAYCVAGRPLGAGVYLQGTQAVNRRPHIH